MILRLHHKYGFMLLEVMLALALLSLGLVIALESFSIGLMSTRRLEGMSIAMNLAQAKLTQVRIKDELIDGVTRGNFREEITDIVPYSRLEDSGWEVEVTSLPPQEWKKDTISLPDTEYNDEKTKGREMKLVTVTISWKTHGRHENFKTSTLVWKKK